MNYIELSIHYQKPDPWYDLIADDLASISFEAFEEREGNLYAYIKKDQFDLQSIKHTATLSKLLDQVQLSHREIEQQNWNEEWESNYKPVVVNEQVLIRAPFHNKQEGFKIDIVIQPKMAFGTGHHETTQLMVGHMLELNLSGKRVLDIGTGTGVLAILAEKLGALDIIAMDTDTWAIENSSENIKVNDCRSIEVLLGSTDEVDAKFDVILANINTNILRDHGAFYFKQLFVGGTIVCSGFLKKDERTVKESYTQNGFTYINCNYFNDWCGIKLVKRGAE